MSKQSEADNTLKNNSKSSLSDASQPMTPEEEAEDREREAFNDETDRLIMHRLSLGVPNPRCARGA